MWYLWYTGYAHNYQARYTYMLMFSIVLVSDMVSQYFQKQNIYGWQNNYGIYNFKFIIFLLQLVSNIIITQAELRGIKLQIHCNLENIAT